MARVGAPYLPIRPAGHKPAPVPYFHELMKAQNMLPVGITALAASAGDDDKKQEDEENPSTSYPRPSSAEKEPNPDDFETDEEWGEAHRKWWEKEKKQKWFPKQDPEGDWVVLDPEGREWSRWGTEAEAEADRKRWGDVIEGYTVKNVKEKADYSFDLPERQQQIIDEIREQMGDQEADALEENIRLKFKELFGKKHAQGGLVGINHLTRRL